MSTASRREPRRGRAVTFDFGQTLAELDVRMLAERLGERGVVLEAAALSRALPVAWASYDRAVRDGGQAHPWRVLMSTLLRGAGIDEGLLHEAVEWLWREQPARNLWRRPIAPMLEVVRDLVARGTPVGILSNSEGKLAELVDEMGLTELFVVIADSGRLGVEKPDRRIFEWVAERLDVPLPTVVHVGDSRAADVDGALSAGMAAIWYAPRGEEALRGPRVWTCRDAAEVRTALELFGTPA